MSWTEGPEWVAWVVETRSLRVREGESGVSKWVSISIEGVGGMSPVGLLSREGVLCWRVIGGGLGEAGWRVVEVGKISLRRLDGRGWSVCRAASS